MPRPGLEKLEIVAVADPVLGIIEERRGLGRAPVGGPGPEADDREAPLRPADALGSSGAAARASAQVARADLVLATTSTPSGPVAASAAPSATP